MKQGMKNPDWLRQAKQMEVITMSANLTTRGIDNTVNGNGGRVWQRLHCERDDICEALLKEPRQKRQDQLQQSGTDDQLRSAVNWHRELLQSRLRKIDDALDRLMSGSYGSCSKCGRWIEETKLDFDPAIAFCIECWQRKQSQSRSDGSIRENSQTPIEAIQQCERLDHLTEIDHSFDGVALETLASFDTIWVRTRNSDYRIFLLDPKTGRALVEGGCHFGEPVEAVVIGSTFGGSTFKIGSIGVGLRIEMWVNDNLVSTSSVQSVRVEHHTRAAPASASSSNLEM
jgi:RNA polymerase-binding transcription factor DksA